MRILVAFILCLFTTLTSSGQALWRNFFTTQQNPIVDVVAGSNATVQASTPAVNIRRFTVNGVTDSNVVSILITNVVTAIGGQTNITVVKPDDGSVLISTNIAGGVSTYGVGLSAVLTNQMYGSNVLGAVPESSHSTNSDNATRLTGVITNHLYIPAGAFMPVATNTASLGTNSITGSDQAKWDTWDFDDSTNEQAQVTFALQGWDLNELKAKVYWTSASASGVNSNVVWSVAVGSAANGDALGAILGTAVTTTNAWGGTAQDLQITSATGQITAGNTPAAGDLLLLNVARSGADAADTLVGDARLLGVMVRYTSTNSPTW